MLKKYAPLAQLAADLGPPLEQAVEQLEGRGQMVTISSMRSMYALVTPEWRSRGLVALKNPNVTLKTLEMVVNQVCHEQWVSFHWRDDNDLISKEACVLRPSPM